MRNNTIWEWEILITGKCKYLERNRKMVISVGNSFLDVVSCIWNSRYCFANRYRHVPFCSPPRQTRRCRKFSSKNWKTFSSSSERPSLFFFTSNPFQVRRFASCVHTKLKFDTGSRSCVSSFTRINVSLRIFSFEGERKRENFKVR